MDFHTRKIQKKNQKSHLRKKNCVSSVIILVKKFFKHWKSLYSTNDICLGKLMKVYTCPKNLYFKIPFFHGTTPVLRFPRTEFYSKSFFGVSSPFFLNNSNKFWFVINICTFHLENSLLFVLFDITQESNQSISRCKYVCVLSSTQQNSNFIGHLCSTVTTWWPDSDGVVTSDNCWQHGDFHIWSTV